MLPYLPIAAVAFVGVLFAVGSFMLASDADDLADKLINEGAHGDWPATSQMKATEHGDRQ